MEEDKVKNLKDIDQRILRSKRLQPEINKLLTEEMAKRMKMVKQENFEFANKTGKWLMYRLRKEK